MYLFMSCDVAEHLCWARHFVRCRRCEDEKATLLPTLHSGSWSKALNHRLRSFHSRHSHLCRLEVQDRGAFRFSSRLADSFLHVASSLAKRGRKNNPSCISLKGTNPIVTSPADIPNVADYDFSGDWRDLDHHRAFKLSLSLRQVKRQLLC